jgi:phosphoglycerate dehydrogenase-like enzyme
MTHASDPQSAKIDTILVLGDVGASQLAMLRRALPGVETIAGNSAEIFKPTAARASVLFNWSGALALFRQVFAMCPNLRWVHSRSVGLERTLFPELLDSRVPLTNGIGVFSPSLGEFVLAAILYFAKDFRRLIRNQNAGVWKPFDVLPIASQTVGIVGYGDIGRAVAARVTAMGMTVLAMKRHAPGPSADPMVQQIFTPEHRIEMLSRCDYVVISTPLTSETRGMIAAREFAAMKPTAVVINVGRGPVIDEQSLIAALATGRIKGAALDVFDQEPLPAGHPFYKLENVLLSPHCADNTPDWLEQAMQLFITQFERFRNGDSLLNVVDKKLGY